eukprot:m.70037 g.70037  ORF g.70037 m.70037 type:complete len:275 (-) comp14285_c0_seq2:314-1138(-)
MSHTDHTKQGVDESRSTTSSSAGGPAAYESNRAVSEYVQFHFGSPEDVMPYAFGPREGLAFPRICAETCARFAAQKGRAIDIGCAVGGSSFHLSKHFDSVVGLDFSHAFVQAATEMKAARAMTYSLTIEGDICETKTAHLPTDVHPERVTFQVGDACNLDLSLGPVDAVLGANLLCRLPEPLKFLTSLAALVRSGGVVVLFSPYSWLPGWTSKDKWIGGVVEQDGSARYSFPQVQKILSADFDLVHQEDVPFVLREHARKFQYGVSHCNVWRRK